MRLELGFAKIIAMLRDVSVDLIPFMIIFFCMIFLSGQTFAVLRLGNATKVVNQLVPSLGAGQNPDPNNSGPLDVKD